MFTWTNFNHVFHTKNSMNYVVVVKFLRLNIQIFLIKFFNIYLSIEILMDDGYNKWKTISES